jgi:hypothetical protein
VINQNTRVVIDGNGDVRCPPGYERKGDECKPKPCPPDTIGTPPDCVPIICLDNPDSEGCPPDPCIQNPDSEGCPPDPCIQNPDLEGCPTSPPDCDENPDAEGCPGIDPCEQNPNAEGCQEPPTQDGNICDENPDAPECQQGDDELAEADDQQGDEGDTGGGGDEGGEDEGGMKKEMVEEMKEMEMKVYIDTKVSNTFENLIFPIIGFAAVLLGLEGAWRWLGN